MSSFKNTMFSKSGEHAEYELICQKLYTYKNGNEEHFSVQTSSTYVLGISVYIDILYF